jgi:hypothetical protein
MSLIFLQPVLAFLSTPNLEYLEVIGSRADYAELSSKPALRTLVLRDMSFPICDAAPYRSFTKLTRLELNNVHGMELLAAADDTGRIPWPDLRTLVCRFPEAESLPWLEGLLNRRPRLTLRALEQHKDSLPALGRSHDVQFVSSDEPLGLIRQEDFEFESWGEEDSIDDDFSGSDFEQYSDEYEAFGDIYDLEVDSGGMEDGVDDYFEDEDDGLEGVEGWLP